MVLIFLHYTFLKTLFIYFREGGEAEWEGEGQ